MKTAPSGRRVRVVRMAPTLALRPLRLVGVLLAAILVETPRLDAGGSVSVGSFAKTTGGAPVTQNVAHGLGESPKAVILWTNGKTNESFSGDILLGFGFTDGTTDKSVAAASEDGAGSSNSSARVANKALTIVQWGETLLAEADLCSWDSTNFTLDWTTNDGNAYVIHFIALGGTDISAKVVGWTMPTVTGNKAVTGVGFEPNVVLHAFARNNLTNSPPDNKDGFGFNLGVMDASGDEWATMATDQDAVDPTRAARGQQTDACLYAVDQQANKLLEAAFVSMDSDGFTVNFSDIDNAAQVISLALEGVNAKAGSFNKTTSGAPASQSVTGVLFEPELVLFASYQDTTQARGRDHARFGIGASDGTTEGSSAFQDQDCVSTSTVDGIDKTSKVFVKVNNNTPAIDAEADFTSFDTDGFTLNWTTNDAVATEILYLALVPFSAIAVELKSFDAAADEDGVTVRWQTGFEVDNLGFHIYREAAHGRVRLTKSILAGSALMTAAGTPLTTGLGYAFRDPAGTPTSRYWLKDFDLNGQHTWHGPVAVDIRVPKVSRDGPPRRGSRAGPPTPLAQVGHRFAGTCRPAAVARRVRSLEPADLETQQDLAAGTAVKLGVRDEGWIRVPAEELIIAGLSRDVDPRRLQLFSLGREVCMTVDGEEDGSFDLGDAIEFYGLGLDTPWADTQSYWLVEGRRGRRIPVEVHVRGRRTTHFPQTIERRDKQIYFAALRNGDAENFFGPIVADEPLVETFTLDHRDPNAIEKVTLAIVLQGLTTGAHQVSIHFNDENVGQAIWVGQAREVVEFAIPPIHLVSGENRVTIQAGTATDVSLLESIRITYPCQYNAQGNTLRCTIPPRSQVTMGGFSSRDIRVMDVTDPENVRELSGLVDSHLDPAITVASGRDETRLLYAFTDSAICPPHSIHPNNPSSWHEDDRGAPLVIVSHGTFLPGLAPFVAERERAGWPTLTVDVEDLYDEFSYGAKTPWALKDFLVHAHTNWASPSRRRKRSPLGSKNAWNRDRR